MTNRIGKVGSMTGKRCREKKQTFKCGITGRTVTRRAPSRISAVRRHRRDAHPAAHRRSIQKSVETRRKNARHNPKRKVKPELRFDKFKSKGAFDPRKIVRPIKKEWKW